MIKIVKFIIWVAGVLAVSYFVLRYFGYEPNFNYIQESKARCRKLAEKCGKELVEQGTKNAKCYSVWDCMDLKLIIKKK